MTEGNLNPNSLNSGESARTQADYSCIGYRTTELPLCSSPAADTGSPLIRTYSEPFYNLGIIHSAVPGMRTSPLSPIQENAVIYMGQGQQVSITPNGHPFIQRTISDPIPLSSPPPAPVIGRTPPRPPLSRDVSPSGGEDQSAKRMKRMREKVKEMSEWCNVMLETDLTPSETEKDHVFVEEQSKEDMEETRLESVSVETKGNALSLQFKCPCGHGYEFLLEGKNCYYRSIDHKLTDSELKS